MSYSHTVAEAGRAALQTYCWIRLTGKACTLMLGRLAFSDDANAWETSPGMYVLDDCSLYRLCSTKQERGIFTGSLPILRSSQAIAAGSQRRIVCLPCSISVPCFEIRPLTGHERWGPPHFFLLRSSPQPREGRSPSQAMIVAAVGLAWGQVPIAQPGAAVPNGSPCFKQSG
jgi:hypothetical protein